ncbi:hypothetical protein SAMN05444008_105182 [Cnuella takakiae]|uniref:Uncharacterized protein n=2 Tax=Cnuella takakiae TaxID=1302690 RepID=A0A1M4ZD99_9BACT|nr:hypothetical protein BUE76_21920 [Cnuella takakiae]SHF16014.1 hypothetical protein SAMN05444008_105182 [Cnuella takakiae]
MVIATAEQPLLRAVPSPLLLQRLRALQGLCEEAGAYTRLYLPFDFTKTPPAQALTLLPPVLRFYLQPTHPGALLPSGLFFDRRRLWLAPSADGVDYTFQQRTVRCRPCSTGKVAGVPDLAEPLPARMTRDALAKAVGQSLGTDTQALDLKVTVDATVVVIEREQDWASLQSLLLQKTDAVISLSVHRASTNALLKTFPRVWVTEGVLPPGTLGIVNIPRASLLTTETDAEKYALLNQFIVHLPALQATVNLTLAASRFDAGARLFFNEAEVAGPTVQPHPQLPGYKQVTATVNGYTPYLQQRRQVVVQNGSHKTTVPVAPLNRYDPTTNTATLFITT